MRSPPSIAQAGIVAHVEIAEIGETVSSDQVATYRQMAEECFAGAQATSDSGTKAQWLALAEQWQWLADNLEKNDAQNDPKQESAST